MSTAAVDWAGQIERLLARVEPHGVPTAAGTADRLAAYCAAVAEAAAWAGLVSPKDIPLLVEKHVAPSIGPLLVERPVAAARWIDVGTGGGFPGMVIKLCRPTLDITLLDSSRKKTIFLERFRRQLAMRDLRIVEARVEECPGTYDVILMRAMAPLSRALPLLDSVSGTGSRLLTFKGPGWEDELAAAQQVLGQHRWRYDGAHEIPWARPRLLKMVRD
jgi:16S rRNA (guanine527-N7)-methyltransferase